MNSPPRFVPYDLPLTNMTIDDHAKIGIKLSWFPHFQRESKKINFLDYFGVI